MAARYECEMELTRCLQSRTLAKDPDRRIVAKIRRIEMKLPIDQHIVDAMLIGHIRLAIHMHIENRLACTSFPDSIETEVSLPLVSSHRSFNLYTLCVPILDLTAFRDS